MYIIIILIVLGVTTSQTVAFTFETDCPVFCVCNYFRSQMVLACNNSQLNGIFRLPSPFLNPSITNTTSFVSINSYLRTIPVNFCEFANTLIQIDLSNNAISDNLNQNQIGCLDNLRYLNLSFNFISFIDANTFNSLYNLEILDLRHNRLTMIPTYLFYFKLPSLTNLLLSYNQITEVDVWMLFMARIRVVDLSHNLIETFVNRVGWNPYYVSSGGQASTAELVDLSYNNLQSLDDQFLLLFSVCCVNEFNYFIELFKQFRLSSNPIICSCLNSYNLMQFYNAYASDHFVSPNDNKLFSTRCQNPDYLGYSVFAFTNPAVCAQMASPFTTKNCGFLAINSTTSSTTSPSSSQVIGGGENLLGTPNSQLAEESIPGLYSAQIAGLVLGAIGFFILFLTLLYCICPIEILALVFNCVPYFYTVCTCKSGVKHSKEYDLFISYNKSNEKWVKNRLVPFIKNNCLVENFILHYNAENKLEEVFGPYIKNIMNRSSCILFVLSDLFLMKEWNNSDFRAYLRYLITKKSIRFVCVQMHDVCDEEVEEYFVEKLQIPRFVSLENDEFLFWPKLAYFLFTNQADDLKVIAPRIHVKPMANKVHPPKAKLVVKDEFSSSLMINKSTSDGFKTASVVDFTKQAIFEVSDSYRCSLPPLRMSRKVDELNAKLDFKKKFLLDEVETNTPVSISNLKIDEKIRLKKTDLDRISSQKNNERKRYQDEIEPTYFKQRGSSSGVKRPEKSVNWNIGDSNNKVSDAKKFENDQPKKNNPYDTYDNYNYYNYQANKKIDRASFVENSDFM